VKDSGAGLLAAAFIGIVPGLFMFARVFVFLIGITIIILLLFLKSYRHCFVYFCDKIRMIKQLNHIQNLKKSI
jgi:hypothetical protein